VLARFSLKVYSLLAEAATVPGQPRHCSVQKSFDFDFRTRVRGDGGLGHSGKVAPTGFIIAIREWQCAVLGSRHGRSRSWNRTLL